MPNYIIDPQVLYWINVLECLQVACTIGSALMGLASLFFVGNTMYDIFQLEEPEKPEDEDSWVQKRYKEHLKQYNKELEGIRKTRKWATICVCIFLVFLVGAIFVPSKQTSVEMLVAKTATFDNVNWSVQQVKEVIDYIVKAIKGVV